MENASKALLLGGGILIGLIVMSIGVYLFTSYSDNYLPFEQKMEANEIKKFNANFTKFEGRDNITIQEIVTLINFAKQYEQESGTHITITVEEIPDMINWLNVMSIDILDDKKVELIEEKSGEIFTCKNDENQDIIYDDKGKVKLIKFSEKI